MGSTTSRAAADDAGTSDASWLGAIRRRLAPHRKRLSRLLVVVLLLAVGTELAPVVPRDVEVEFALGPDHGDIVQIRVGYVQDGHVFQSVRFDHPDGAPGVIVHRLSLPTGAYEVTVELLHRDGGERRVQRRLESPSEGRLRLLVGETP